MRRRRSAFEPEWAAVPLRLVTGIVFAAHGAQKVFQFGLEGTAGFLARIGVPAPTLAAAVVISVELLGGLALIAGVLVRWASVLLAINMLVAILKVHLAQGFFLPAGYEFALTLLGALVALMVLGAGPASVDRLRGG